MHYNMLNEVDYYPRDKFSPELNPTYGDRKRNINESMAEVGHFAPTAMVARHWLGSMLAWLDHPVLGEDELFDEAAEEVEQMQKKVRSELAEKSEHRKYQRANDRIIEDVEEETNG